MKLISIAVISIGIGASAGCGSNSRDTVRSIDVSTLVKGTTATVTSFTQNPTAGHLHELLRPAGYKVDIYRDNLAWKNGKEAIYFQVQGSGNGQFERQIRRLTMFKAGKRMWSSHKVKAKRNEIFIWNTKQQWEKVFDGKSFSFDQSDAESSLSRDTAIKAFQQRRTAHLSKVAREGLTPEIEAELLALQRERDILLQKYFQKENGGHSSEKENNITHFKAHPRHLSEDEKILVERKITEMILKFVRVENERLGKIDSTLKEIMQRWPQLKVELKLAVRDSRFRQSLDDTDREINRLYASITQTSTQLQYKIRKLKSLTSPAYSTRQEERAFHLEQLNNEYLALAVQHTQNVRELVAYMQRIESDIKQASVK